MPLFSGKRKRSFIPLTQVHDGVRPMALFLIFLIALIFSLVFLSPGTFSHSVPPPLSDFKFQDEKDIATVKHGKQSINPVSTSEDRAQFCITCLALYSLARVPVPSNLTMTSCDPAACLELSRLSLQGTRSTTVGDAMGSGGIQHLSRDVVFPKAALIVIYSEFRRSLLTSLANWANNAWWMTRYELVVLYAEGKASGDDLASFASLAPGWKISLLPFSYDASFQTSAFEGGGGGGLS